MFRAFRRSRTERKERIPRYQEIDLNVDYVATVFYKGIMGDIRKGIIGIRGVSKYTFGRLFCNV